VNSRKEDIFNRFRTDKHLALALLERVNRLIDRPINLMEVCGTHTQAISAFGIRRAVDSRLQLLSGPGCPVCVTPQEDIDRAIELSKRKDTIIVTFGDMMRVPGSFSSLEKEHARGAEIRIVYSPLDCLKIAQENPNKAVVFIGVGFETTAPTIAASVVAAKKSGIKNFWVLPFFKLIPPALRMIASAKEIKVDGFILPGHVSTIIGSRPYEFLPQEFKKSCAIVGFELLDILQGIEMLLLQLKNSPAVEIQYNRIVKANGNPVAQAVLNTVFKPVDSNWRGIGSIKNSGLAFSTEFQDFDANRKFDMTVRDVKINPACRCGDVLLGLLVPPQCPLFGRGCDPEDPIGPCMVSSEGACAAYYKYDYNYNHGRHGRRFKRH
jgi:hydrogenase expression/formation protein HypD